jgi:hypothetical protein
MTQMTLDQKTTAALSLAVVVMLGASAICLTAAPLLLPDSYSWIEHTTSEAAAQGVDGAWLARLGFLLFGFAVLALCALKAPAWGLRETLLLGAFGVLMVANAAFSHCPWEPSAPCDATEDTLHSVSATAVGFAFTLGVLSVAIRGRDRSDARRYQDLVAVVASIALPFAMAVFPGQDGAIQRVMFLVAYVWFGTEAISARRSGD